MGLLLCGWHGSGGHVQGLQYFGYLATTVPSGELAGLAWRRLRRAAVRRLDEFTPRQTATDIVASMGLRSVEELANRLRDDRAARSSIEPNERAEARRLVQTLLPGYAASITSDADRILQGELFLFGEWREYARGELAPGIAAIDWTRDPLRGGHSPARVTHLIDRDAEGTDSRAIWEAARLTSVYRLAQAHLLQGLPGTEAARGATDHGVYARAAVLQVRDFLATQPLGFGIHWTCAMEAALRLMNLVPAVLLLRDAPELDAFFWAEFVEAVVAHARFIERELEDTQTVPGNHLLSDLAGLVTVGCLLPELPGSLHWRTWGLRTFSEELVRQTTLEGLAFEASLPYHRFTTELGLFVQSIARRQGLALDPAALTTLWGMCEVAAGATLPDGKIPSVGDNDSTRAFAVQERSPLDARHLSALRSALGGPGSPTSIEAESLWLGGVCGMRRNEQQAHPRMRVVKPEQHLFSASGLTVLRDDDRAVTLWAGDNGQHGLGGHAHNDKLSSEIVLRGERIVIDPGCPTYLADPEERNRYRSTAVHPTVQIDHLEQSELPVGRPFLLPEAAQASVVRTTEKAAWAEHRGYLRARPGVLHRREIALPSLPDVVCVTDWLLGEGDHVVDLRWPFTRRDVVCRRASQAERDLLERLENSTVGESRFDAEHVFAIGPNVILAIACEQPWEAELTEGAFSPGYGERVCNQTATIRLRAQCPLVVTSAFAWVGTAQHEEGFPNPTE
jgi:hypothetical protein